MRTALKRPIYIALMGAPGVGKGTFAARLGPYFGVPSISTGDLVREEIKKATELGKHLKAITDRGELVTDEIITQMLRNRLSQPDASQGFLLDGYPRRVSQAEILSKYYKLDLVVNIELRKDVLIQKITSRRVCQNCGANYNLADIRMGEIDMPPLLPREEGKCDQCGGKLVQRSDDLEETVRERLAVYEAQTRPLIDYYGKLGCLAEFRVKKGIKDLPDVIALIESRLAAKQQH